MMNHLTIETEDSLASLLELAANNDMEGFKRMIERDPFCVDEVGLWYSRQKGSRQMVNELRTPLMVAATYGSIDVVDLILSFSGHDINKPCGLDKSTALHCAASGGAENAVDVVKLLLAAGADSNSVDGNGHRPVDVIVVSPKHESIRNSLEALLQANDSTSVCNRRVITATSKAYSPPISTSPENGSPSAPDYHLRSRLNDDIVSSGSQKKAYPVHPSLPDINTGLYSTDEFRMFSFKVRPCSRAYSHDWTECPFVHPGENARRRDPRKYHYSSVPCPDFEKNSCPRGDMCQYSHGVFECWLHPAQYRTRPCKEGPTCSRRVCFFAHTAEELRPLYVSTGSAVLSPCSSTCSAMDFAGAMSVLPGSPSSVSVMSPSRFTPPRSPSTNGMSHSSGCWHYPNVPALHLPGSNLHSTRLRSSFNARDIPIDDSDLLPDYDVQQNQQLFNEFSCRSKQPKNSNAVNRSGRIKTLAPSNLDIFSSESSSPRFADPALASAVFSPTHKSAILNQFHQQQSMLSPVNTSFSSKNVESPLLQSPLGVPLSGRMSPPKMEAISPRSPRVSLLSRREKRQQLRSLSSRELGSKSATVAAAGATGSPVNSWSNWGSSNGTLDWAVSADELGKLRRSSSNTSTQMDTMDQFMLRAWLEKMQLGHLVAQQN